MTFAHARWKARDLTYLFFVVAICLVSRQVHAQGVALNAIEELRTKDEGLQLKPGGSSRSLVGSTPSAAALSANFTMRVTHPFDSEQSSETKHVSVVWDNEARLIKVVSEYDHAPIHRPANTVGYQPYDYDAEGNLIIWRTQELYAISNAERNEAVEVLVMHRIDRAGKSIERQIYSQRYLYSVESTDSAFLFDQFRMATGWGISEQLRDMVSSEPAGNGRERVVAVGSFGGGMTGEWSVTYDRGSTHLIRQGNFVPLGSSEPYATLSSEGIVETNGLEIAKSGRYRAGTYSAEVDVARFMTLSADEFDSDPLRKEIAQKIDAAPSPASEIIDFRGPVPKRIGFDVPADCSQPVKEVSPASE